MGYRYTDEEIAALNADNDRMRAALSLIAELEVEPGFKFNKASLGVAIELARAALNQK